MDIEQQKAARAAYRKWMIDRSALLSLMVGAATWQRVPYPAKIKGSGAALAALMSGNHPDERHCLAFQGSEFLSWQAKFDVLATSAAEIAQLYGKGAGERARAMWLPIFMDVLPRSIVYQQHTAHSSGCAKDVEKLRHEERVWENGVSRIKEHVLDVKKFLAEHGWQPENVTIRYESGTRHVARCIWPDGSTTREQSWCIVLNADDDQAEQIVELYHGAKKHARTDARTPDASWYEWEFIHYPAGRPTKPRAV